jgi:hypothetical protein
MRLRHRPISLAIGVAAVILLAEVGLNIWQHLGETRYFAWAPNDYLVTYDVGVSAHGRPLSPAEIERRYHLDLSNRLGEDAKAKLGLLKRERYVFEDAPQELLDQIRRYEETKGKNDDARVTVVYQLDGGKEKAWQWPR